MNHMRKQSAVNKFQSLYENGASEQDLKEAISLDEKGYSPEEVIEIADAILAAGKGGDGDQGKGGENNTPPAPPEKEKKSVKKATTKAEAEVEEKEGYEEWRMERVNGKLEKLKKIREGVKISEDEAETLNSGAASPNASNPIMYILPE